VQAEVGSTFVYVTHDQHEAMTMSDRIAVMNAGHVEQIGSPQEIYDQPASRFVAEFIGNTNLFEVSLAHTTGGATRARAGGLDVVLPGNHAIRADHASLSVRYERVRVGADAAGLANSFEGRVQDVSFTGSTVHYTVKLSDAPVELVAEVTHDAGRPLLHRGDTVAVGWEPGSALLLPDSVAAA
jgi:ABC-type Fe3+/spermidine/putrescine transport system ATPase subunit